MLFIDIKDIVVLILLAFLLVGGYILVVDRIAQAEKKRRKGKKGDRRK